MNFDYLRMKVEVASTSLKFDIIVWSVPVFMRVDSNNERCTAGGHGNAIQSQRIRFLTKSSKSMPEVVYVVDSD